MEQASQVHKCPTSNSRELRAQETSAPRGTVQDSRRPFSARAFHVEHSFPPQPRSRLPETAPRGTLGTDRSGQRLGNTCAPRGTLFRPALPSVQRANVPRGAFWVRQIRRRGFRFSLTRAILSAGLFHVEHPSISTTAWLRRQPMFHVEHLPCRAPLRPDPSVELSPDAHFREIQPAAMFPVERSSHKGFRSSGQRSVGEGDLYAIVANAKGSTWNVPPEDRSHPQVFHVEHSEL